MGKHTRGELKATSKKARRLVREFEEAALESLTKMLNSGLCTAAKSRHC